MTDSPLFSVMVAASAVVVGAVMQYFTLKIARTNTVSSLRVGVVEASIVELKKVLSEYIPLSFDIDARFGSYKMRGVPLDAEYYKLIREETRLFALIELSLDLNEVTHREFLQSINKLRTDDDNSWLSRRSEVITRTNALIIHDRKKALSGE